MTTTKIRSNLLAFTANPGIANKLGATLITAIEGMLQQGYTTNANASVCKLIVGIVVTNKTLIHEL
jgi:hypothetical protein